MSGIEMRTEAYCDRCPEFDPVSEKDIRWRNGEAYVAGIEVRCAHAQRCSGIAERIRSEMNTNEHARA
jgi:hypothetical protein